MKNLLFTLLLFFSFPFTGVHAVAGDPDSIRYIPASRLMQLQPADSADFPPLNLLHTALAGS